MLTFEKTRRLTRPSGRADSDAGQFFLFKKKKVILLLYVLHRS